VKKIVCILLAIAGSVSTVGGGGFAKDGMLLAPKSIAADAGIGTSWFSGPSVGAGAEYVIGKFDVAKIVPLSFGAAVRAQFYLDSIDAKPLYLGGFATLHLDWGSLDWAKGIDWLANVDSYIGVGLKMRPAFGFDTIGGTSYFFMKNLAVNVEAGLYGGAIGLLFKF
jgi:hypothetical protein